MKIRQMENTDLDFAFSCTMAEGWLSETKDLFDNFLSYDPKGCFIAEENNNRIGICIATKYKQNGFIGELIVIEKKRGRGVGKSILEKAINYLRDCGIKNIYLDGDLDAVPLYERIGFRKIYKSLRYIGKIKGRPYKHVVSPTSEDINVICNLDRKLFGDERTFFLKRRFLQHPELCKIVKKDSEIISYLFAQPGLNVISIGPWAVLDYVEKPVELLESIAYELEDQTIRLGILENNTKAIDVVESIESIVKSEPSWRMVLGDESYLGSNQHLFAIGSASKG